MVVNLYGIPYQNYHCNFYRDTWFHVRERSEHLCRHEGGASPCEGTHQPSQLTNRTAQIESGRASPRWAVESSELAAQNHPLFQGGFLLQLTNNSYKDIIMDLLK